MTDKQILEEPLPVLESELWEILRLGIPKALLSDETLSDDLHRLHLGVRHMSEVLAAREAWRREQQPAFVMRAGIERYDNQLVTHVERLSPLREKAHRSLLAHGRTLRRQ